MKLPISSLAPRWAQPLLLASILMLASSLRGQAQVLDSSLIKQAQEFEELYQKQENEFKQADQKAALVYGEFKAKLDKAFTAFLRKEWSVIPAKSPKPDPDKTPKPEKTPEAGPDIKPEPKIVQLESLDPLPLDTEPGGLPEIPRSIRLQVPNRPPMDPDEPRQMFTYLDQALSVNYALPPMVGLAPKLDNQAIADYWEYMSQSDYAGFLKSLWQNKEDLQLNDWGYIAMIREVSRQVHGNKVNEARLLSWFLLLQSGYQSKIGLSENTVYLLLPAQSIIYERAYYNLNDVNYFVLDTKEKQIPLAIYPNDYPEAQRIPDLSLPQSPQLAGKVDKRSFHFSFASQEYTIDLKYPKALVDFYKSYPLVDLKYFFAARPAEVTIQSLHESLDTILQELPVKRQVDFLLKMVQTGLEYQTDQEQFGYEKPMFVEETLYYPYSDCEDRSVLFAFMVRELLDLDILALDYPGHITTAVHLEGDRPGHRIELHGKKYWICDPTYINAQVGDAMDSYRNQTPKPILVP